MTVPWEVYLEDEFLAHHLKFSLREYYLNPGFMLEKQLAAREYFERKFGLGRFVIIGPNLSTYVLASGFGLKIVFPENETPMPLPDERPLKSIEDVDRLSRLDLTRDGLFPVLIKNYRVFCSKIGKEKVSLGKGVCLAPSTDALELRGNGFFMDLYDNPQKAKKLIELCTDTTIEARKLINSEKGAAETCVGICDDAAGMLSPDHFKEFVIPYWEKIYNAFPSAAHRGLHSELLSREHLMIARDVLTAHGGHFSYDPSGNRKLTIKDLREIVGDHFKFQLKVGELMTLSPAEISALYRQYVEEGAPKISIFPNPGVSDENLEAALKEARRYE